MRPLTRRFDKAPTARSFIAGSFCMNKPSMKSLVHRRIRRELGRWSCITLCLIAFVTIFKPDQTQAQSGPTDYQIKAVFLFNFAQFVEWPASAFSNSQTPLVIGVLGQDPFGSYLDETVRDERVNNRPLVVQRYRRAEDIGTCHILFISRSETSRLGDVLDKVRGRNILTVSDGEGFSARGGIIQFVTTNNKVRLRINLAAARTAGLTISSKLLRPAELVNP